MKVQAKSGLEAIRMETDGSGVVLPEFRAGDYLLIDPKTAKIAVVPGEMFEALYAAAPETSAEPARQTESAKGKNLRGAALDLFPEDGYIVERIRHPVRDAVGVKSGQAADVLKLLHEAGVSEATGKPLSWYTSAEINTLLNRGDSEINGTTAIMSKLFQAGLVVRRRRKGDSRRSHAIHADGRKWLKAYENEARPRRTLVNPRAGDCGTASLI